MKNYELIPYSIKDQDIIVAENQASESVIQAYLRDHLYSGAEADYAVTADQIEDCNYTTDSGLELQAESFLRVRNLLEKSKFFQQYRTLLCGGTVGFLAILMREKDHDLLRVDLSKKICRGNLLRQLQDLQVDCTLYSELKELWYTLTCLPCNFVAATNVEQVKRNAAGYLIGLKKDLEQLYYLVMQFPSDKHRIKFLTLPLLHQLLVCGPGIRISILAAINWAKGQFSPERELAEFRLSIVDKFHASMSMGDVHVYRFLNLFFADEFNFVTPVALQYRNMNDELFDKKYNEYKHGSKRQQFQDYITRQYSLEHFIERVHTEFTQTLTAAGIIAEKKCLKNVFIYDTTAMRNIVGDEISEIEYIKQVSFEFMRKHGLIPPGCNEIPGLFINTFLMDSETGNGGKFLINLDLAIIDSLRQAKLLAHHEQYDVFRVVGNDQQFDYMIFENSYSIEFVLIKGNAMRPVEQFIESHIKSLASALSHEHFAALLRYSFNRYYVLGDSGLSRLILSVRAHDVSEDMKSIISKICYEQKDYDFARFLLECEVLRLDKLFLDVKNNYNIPQYTRYLDLLAMVFGPSVLAVPAKKDSDEDDDEDSDEEIDCYPNFITNVMLRCKDKPELVWRAILGSAVRSSVTGTAKYAQALDHCFLWLDICIACLHKAGAPICDIFNKIIQSLVAVNRCKNRLTDFKTATCSAMNYVVMYALSGNKLVSGDNYYAINKHIVDMGLYDTVLIAASTSSIKGHNRVATQYQEFKVHNRVATQYQAFKDYVMLKYANDKSKLQLLQGMFSVLTLSDFSNGYTTVAVNDGNNGANPLHTYFLSACNKEHKVCRIAKKALSGVLKAAANIDEQWSRVNIDGWSINPVRHGTIKNVYTVGPSLYHGVVNADGVSVVRGEVEISGGNEPRCYLYLVDDAAISMAGKRVQIDLYDTNNKLTNLFFTILPMSIVSEILFYCISRGDTSLVKTILDKPGLISWSESLYRFLKKITLATLNLELHDYLSDKRFDHDLLRCARAILENNVHHARMHTAYGRGLGDMFDILPMYQCYSYVLQKSDNAKLVKNPRIASQYLFSILDRDSKDLHKGLDIDKMRLTGALYLLNKQGCLELAFSGLYAQVNARLLSGYVGFSNKLYRILLEYIFDQMQPADAHAFMCLFTNSMPASMWETEPRLLLQDLEDRWITAYPRAILHLSLASIFSTFSATSLDLKKGNVDKVRRLMVALKSKNDTAGLAILCSRLSTVRQPHISNLLATSGITAEELALYRRPGLLMLSFIENKEYSLEELREFITDLKHLSGLYRYTLVPGSSNNFADNGATFAGLAPESIVTACFKSRAFDKLLLCLQQGMRLVSNGVSRASALVVFIKEAHSLLNSNVAADCHSVEMFLNNMLISDCVPKLSRTSWDNLLNTCSDQGDQEFIMIVNALESQDGVLKPVLDAMIIKDQNKKPLLYALSHPSKIIVNNREKRSKKREEREWQEDLDFLDSVNGNDNTSEDQEEPNKKRKKHGKR